MYYLEQRRKFDNILTNAKAGTPYPKYFKASEVNLTSSLEKDPYPNKALTISSDAKLNQSLLVLIIIKKVQKTCFECLTIFLYFYF